MDSAVLDGIELEYALEGAGDPVVLIPAGVCADFFSPLLREPALMGGHRVLAYHRIGYAGSSRTEGAVGIADQAAHCRRLMRRLGLERAHIVGHSSSAMIALQLALDAPAAVQSLALLDSARPAPSSELQMEFVRGFVKPALEHWRAGDTAGAIDTWMQGVCGPDYVAPLEAAIPGAFDQAVADADTFFGQELPAVQGWTFTEADAGRVTQPVLVIVGESSAPIFWERRELLLAWLPDAEPFVLPGATHLLHVENPSGMAEGLAAFFARHPLPPSA